MPITHTPSPVAHQMAAVMADSMSVDGCVRDSDFLAAGIERREIDTNIDAAKRLYQRQHRTRRTH